jgi:voltage-gated potassium channel
MAKPVSGHVIVCGYGTLGEKVVDVLSGHNIPFILIEIDAKKAARAKDLGYYVVEGDATRSQVLKSANIIGARAVAIALDDDAKNLFTVLTARDLNKKLFIAARANDEFVREKLIEAGADYIVMPQMAASREIINELLKPE